MERSQYLAQALQDMGSAPAIQAPAVNLDSAIANGQARRDYKMNNPGQSFMGHNLREAGSRIMGAPQNVASNLKGLFGLGRAAGAAAAPMGAAGVQVPY